LLFDFLHPHVTFSSISRPNIFPSAVLEHPQCVPPLL
jgi:hypothetical protein